MSDRFGASEIEDLLAKHLPHPEQFSASDKWNMLLMANMVAGLYEQPTDHAVVKALLHGLTTDGAHHKQYDLEQAFRALCTAEYVDKAKAEFQWEDGIPS